MSLSKYARYVPVGLFLLLYFAVRSLYFDYFPIWDSRIYYDALLHTQSLSFDFLQYTGGVVSTGGHNSQGWIFLAGVPNYFFPHNYYAYNIWIALLGTSAVASFYAIVSELSKVLLGVGERLLLTALFAFYPAILANQIHTTPDTGLLIFWVWFLLALLKEKFLLATLAGVLLLFSKEPAMLFLPIIYIFCALRQPHGMRVSWIKKHSMVVWLPFSIMAIFLFYKAGIRHQPLFFSGFLQNSVSVLHVWPDASFVMYVLMALMLNFNWLLLGLEAVLSIWLFRMPQMDKRQAIAAAWLLFATLSVILAVRHFSNVRYLMPAYTAMVLYLAALLPAIPDRKVRVGALAVLLACFGWQNVRSADPLSNALFCTSKFGTHSVVVITDNYVCSLNETKLWVPKDALVYSLEFMNVPFLLHDIMKDIRPDNDTVFLVPSGYDDDMFSGLDKNYHQTNTDVQVKPKIYELLPAVKPRDRRFDRSLPDTLYYLEFPTEDIRQIRQYLSSLYSGVTEKTYDHDGYWLTVLTLYHKNNGDWCEPL